ncbi:MAG: dephospho-CoA kinase [bacterium]|nr:dephospho-CoA kinase [Candidatus Limimorpha equi]
MEQTVDRTVFNEAQLALLNAFSSLTSEKDLLLLKQAISEFFAKRADEEMEKLWESGEWNQQTLEDLRTAHYRTPYKK